MTSFSGYTLETLSLEFWKRQNCISFLAIIFLIWNAVHCWLSEFYVKMIFQKVVYCCVSYFIGLKQSESSAQIYCCEGSIKLQPAAGGFYVGTCGFECVQYTDCSRRLALPLLTPVHSFTAVLPISSLSRRQTKWCSMYRAWG